MWESLARTQRQDRVLHGMAKLLSILAAIVAIPAWLIGQRLAGPLQRLLARFDPAQPPPLPLPPPRERTMRALWEDLRGIPSKLHAVPRAELRKGLPDLTSFVFAQHRGIAGIAYSYPAQFRDQVFEGADGVPIGASVAVHDEGGRPGLVVVHGLFSSRRFDYVREIAVTAYYEWGFNVAAIDLRGFGLTEQISPAPSTAGWKEGQDIVAAARMLKGFGATTVGALGISLGGSSVLNASFAEGADAALDGGIIAISGPADPRRAAERLSRSVPWRHPAYPLNAGFRAMLTSRVRGSRWPVEVENLADAVDHLAAPFYGLTPDEIWENAAARNGIAGAKVPLLILHPEDDKIIPVDHAHELAEAATGNDNVRVWVLPGGAHGATDAIDREWTYAVYRTFFERWARYDAPASDNGRVVYSPAHAETSEGERDER